MDSIAVGIDVSKKKLDVALLVGSKVKRKSCANDPHGFEELLGWLAKHTPGLVHACLEATGTFSDGVALALVNAGHTVSLVNPARIKGFAQSQLSRTKTDDVDAALIARFCAALQPEAWAPPPPELRELQALVRRLDALHDMRLQETNRLASGIPSETVTASIQQVIVLLDREIDEIEERIKEHFDRHQDLKDQRELLTSIPGIGEKTAAVILAELRCIHDYTSARQLAAYCGLTPKERLSGTSVRGKTRLAKTGNAKLRKALYMPAVVAKRYNKPLQAFVQRLQDRGKTPMAIIGAIMRKLIHIAYGVLKSGQPFNPALACAA